MKFLVTPDSFKGSISAKRVCEIVKEAILDQNKNNTVYTFPAFDGGEGSAEYLTEIFHGKQIRMQAKNATGETETESTRDGGETVAACGGLVSSRSVLVLVSVSFSLVLGFSSRGLGFSGLRGLPPLRPFDLAASAFFPLVYCPPLLPPSRTFRHASRLRICPA